MGAHNFFTFGKGKTVVEAYDNAVKNAYFEDGHDSYNGTISTTQGVIDVGKYFPKGTTDKTKKKVMARLTTLQDALQTNEYRTIEEGWFYHDEQILLDEPSKDDKYARRVWFELSIPQRQIALRIIREVMPRIQKWGPAAGVTLASGKVCLIGWAAS